MKTEKLKCWICKRNIKIDQIQGRYIEIPFTRGWITFTQPCCKKCIESIKFWVQWRSNI